MAWIPDVAAVFAPEADLIELIEDYVTKNPDSDRKHIGRVLQRLGKIINNHLGIIELAEDLDIETVTEIFIRVNSAGTALSQADFAMSKIAANETYGGNMLRKAIDYFCHLAVAPEFYSKIKNGDKAFAEYDFFPKLKWLKDVNDDLYDPSYTDMLRVAFTSEFKRGKLQDLVALLSGRNFETKQYEDAIAEESFDRLKTGILNFMNKTHYDRLIMTLRSSGFITSKLIGGQNGVNFAYIVYLRGRAENVPAADLERLVRRWYVMSLLSGRYAGNPETTFDQDIRQIGTHGLLAHTSAVIEAELGEGFWTGLLPQQMDTSSSTSPFFHCYLAAQVKLGDLGFLSRDITVRDLLLNRSDVHHVFPRNHLKKKGLARGRYNQIANFVIAQSEINIAIGDRDPKTYFKELAEQCAGGSKKYGGITKRKEMEENFLMSCLPVELLDGGFTDYDEFLKERRKLMAQKIKTWFNSL